MSSNAPDAHAGTDTSENSRTYILAAGFGTTVAMWAVGYACRMPPAAVPGSVVLILMVACVLLGGMTVGRHTRAGARGGALVGALSAVLNLLVLGSLIGGDDTNTLIPSALMWIPGSILASALVAALGAAIMHRKPGPQYARDEWLNGFVLVAAFATLLLVIAGGVVTSTNSGLAVPDWPNSFGSNMFLYPLSRMTGGIYFEHAHRLYGSLVGLTTIVLAVALWLNEDRRWVRVTAIMAVFMVVVQGLMGGLRVDGGLSFSTDRAVTEPNIVLAIVHGVFGQVFFATILLLWAFTTRTWRERVGSATVATATSEHSFSKLLVAGVLAQVIFGALYRHLATPETPLPWPAHAHLTLAALVALVALLVGLRLWSKYPASPMLRRLGIAMLVLIALQLLLGVAALVAVLAGRGAESAPPLEVMITTAHQANGALILVLSVQAYAWTRRLLAPAPESAPEISERVVPVPD